MGLRLKLLDRIVDFSNNTKFDESTIIDANYSQLKNKEKLNQHSKGIWLEELKQDFVELMRMNLQLLHYYPLQDGKMALNKMFTKIVER